MGTTWHIMRDERDRVNFAGCRRCSLTFSISLFNASFIIWFTGGIRRKTCRRALALHTPIKFRLSSTYCSSILQIRSILLNFYFATTIICCLHSSAICLWQTGKFVDMTQNIECIPVLCQGPKIWNPYPLHDPVWILDFHAKWPYNSINICKQSNVFIVIYSKHFSFASPSSLANIILLYRTLFSSIKSQFLTLFSSKYETSDTVQHLSTSKMMQSVSCNVESWNA